MMRLIRFRSTWGAAAISALAAFLEGRAAQAQEKAASARVAVIDLDRMAAESQPGKKLLQKLKEENDRLVAEQRKKEQEITEARRRVDVTAPDAKAPLVKEIERKEIELKRWLEDKQREFQESRESGENELQKQFGPIIEQYAAEKGIGLIFRATPGLTFVLDPALDVTSDVIARVDAAAAQAAAKAETPKEPAKK